MKIICKLSLTYPEIILLISLCISLLSCSSHKQNEINSNEIENSEDKVDWQYVGPGGGGAMFSPAVSPHNPDFAFVSCDMTGSFVTKDGGQSWRIFNLRGKIDYYVFDPQDPDIIYAKSSALFRSEDGGDTWKLLYPAPSEVLGIISKGDHANEMLVTNDSTRREVQALAVDPGNSARLYAIIQMEEDLSFYISNDQGENWVKEKALSSEIMDIFVDPSSPADNRTICITAKQSVTVYENGHWQTRLIPEEVKGFTSYAGGFTREENKFVLYAISGKSYFNPQGDKSGIYFSEDGGRTWENRQQGLVGLKMESALLPEWRAIATSAQHPEVVYVSYADLQVHPDTVYIGVAKSEDYGKHWQLMWKDNVGVPGGVVASNMKDGWLNERFGPSWGENPFAIGVSPDNPDVVYTTDFGRTLKTTDGGITWQQVYTQKKAGAGWASRGLQVTTGYGMFFDPFNENHVFMANTDTGLMVSNDGGKSWESATDDNGVPRNWVNSTYWLVFDPEKKDKLWAVMSGTHDLPRPKMWRNGSVSHFKGGVLISNDGGKTWEPGSKDIGETAPTHILLDPESDLQSRTLYVCAFGKGVYKSTDGGRSWEQKNKGIEGAAPFAWRITRSPHKGELFLVVSRSSEDGSIGNEEDGALYRSKDGAATWTRMVLPEGCNGPTSLVCDPNYPERLLLSAWGRKMDGRFSSDEAGGIYITEDDGNTWTHVLENDQHIHDITFDPRNNVYYACGFNASAYRSEDNGNTWERIKGYNFKWGKRVDPDPRHPEKVFITTFGGGVWYGPAQGDVNATEDIVTPDLSYK